MFRGKGAPPPRKRRAKKRRALMPTAQIAHEHAPLEDTVTVTDDQGRILKRIKLRAEAPDQYGMVQIAHEDQELTPYQKILARNREERALRNWHGDAQGLKNWQLEKPTQR